MDFDIEQLKEKIKFYTDEEIIKIIFIDKDDYVDEVITIVEDEYSKREIDEVTTHSFVKQCNNDKSTNSKQLQSKLSIKWLQFWNYIFLPACGIWGLFIIVIMSKSDYATSLLRLFISLVSVLIIATALGLHNRKLWAWKTNWIVIYITLINIGFYISTKIAVFLTLKITATDIDSYLAYYEVIWFCISLMIIITIIWPQVVYWKKRKFLFEDQSVLTPNEHGKH